MIALSFTNKNRIELVLKLIFVIFKEVNVCRHAVTECFFRKSTCNVTILLGLILTVLSMYRLQDYNNRNK